MSSLFLMVTITDRRSTDAFLQLYEQRGVDVNLRTVGLPISQDWAGFLP